VRERKRGHRDCRVGDRHFEAGRRLPFAPATAHHRGQEQARKKQHVIPSSPHVPDAGAKYCANTLKPLAPATLNRSTRSSGANRPLWLPRKLRLRRPRCQASTFWPGAYGEHFFDRAGKFAAGAGNILELHPAEALRILAEADADLDVRNPVEAARCVSPIDVVSTQDIGVAVEAAVDSGAWCRPAAEANGADKLGWGFGGWENEHVRDVSRGVRVDTR
jgi:hypothetical protein